MEDTKELITADDIRNRMRKKFHLIFMLAAMVMCLTSCGSDKIKSWNVEDYEQLEDIIRIDEVENDESTEVLSYKIRYKSDECEVIAYLSIPEKCLENEETYPCIIYNRGGNREFGANKPELIAYFAESLDKIVFATQYRGVSGGTGQDEFGGDDLHDVLKLLDLCEEFSFVDMDQLYMMGASRGGMMTYMAIREDDRIKKAIVVCGEADNFMGWEEREDMHEVYMDLIGETPEEAPEEYEKRSAVYWADEIKCPVLIIHSELDERVSYAQAEKMVHCLEEADKEYKFISYEDDLHGFHPEDFEVILDWLQ